MEGIDGPVVNHSTLDAQKKGISTVYQEVNLCPNLSVAENLFIEGTENKTWNDRLEDHGRKIGKDHGQSGYKN